MLDPRPLPVLLLAACTACASATQPDFEAARAAARAASGVEEFHDPARGPLDGERLAAALADGLARDEALRLALGSNPRFVAEFHALGVADAERQQAGLLANPELSLALLFPSGGGAPKLAFELLGSVTELWRVAPRRAQAEAQYEAELLALAYAAAELARATALAFDAAVRAEGEFALRVEGLELARAQLELVQAGVASGVLGASAEEQARTARTEAETEVARADVAHAVARAELAAVLGLESALDCALLEGALDRTGAQEPDPEPLVAQALQARLDLAAAAAAVQAAEQALGGARRANLPAADAGLGFERDEDGAEFLGLAGSLELPLFDPGTARVTRARFQLEELRERQRALVVEVSQEVRAAVVQHAEARRTLTTLESELLPRAEQRVRRLERAVAAGDATRSELLEARRAWLTARAAELEARQRARAAELELGRALGRPVEAGNRAAAGDEPGGRGGNGTPGEG